MKLWISVLSLTISIYSAQSQKILQSSFIELPCSIEFQGPTPQGLTQLANAVIGGNINIYTINGEPEAFKIASSSDIVKLKGQIFYSEWQLDTYYNTGEKVIYNGEFYELTSEGDFSYISPENDKQWRKVNSDIILNELIGRISRMEVFWISTSEKSIQPQAIGFYINSVATSKPEPLLYISFKDFRELRDLSATMVMLPKDDRCKPEIFAGMLSIFPPGVFFTTYAPTEYLPAEVQEYNGDLNISLTKQENKYYLTFQGGESEPVEKEYLIQTPTDSINYQLLSLEQFMLNHLKSDSGRKVIAGDLNVLDYTPVDNNEYVAIRLNEVSLSYYSVNTDFSLLIEELFNQVALGNVKVYSDDQLVNEYSTLDLLRSMVLTEESYLFETWSVDKFYTKGETVFYNEQQYRATKDNLNGESPSANDSSWVKLEYGPYTRRLSPTDLQLYSVQSYLYFNKNQYLTEKELKSISFLYYDFPEAEWFFKGEDVVRVINEMSNPWTVNFQSNEIGHLYNFILWNNFPFVKKSLTALFSKSLTSLDFDYPDVNSFRIEIEKQYDKSNDESILPLLNKIFDGAIKGKIPVINSDGNPIEKQLLKIHKDRSQIAGRNPLTINWLNFITQGISDSKGTFSEIENEYFWFMIDSDEIVTGSINLKDVEKYLGDKQYASFKSELAKLLPSLFYMRNIEPLPR